VTGSDALPEPLATIAASVGAPGLKLRDHGPHHWKCVALTGLEIASRDPAVDLQTVYVFAQLHDSQRLNEYSDPEHGPRAAKIAAATIKGPGPALPDFEPGGERAEKLVEAIRDHTTAVASDDPTIGACWDADRFNLWRVGIKPDRTFISTAAAHARFDELSRLARRRIEDTEPTWAAVAKAIGGQGFASGPVRGQISSQRSRA
jgi:uncharacterized protein